MVYDKRVCIRVVTTTVYGGQNRSHLIREDTVRTEEVWVLTVCGLAGCYVWLACSNVRIMSRMQERCVRVISKPPDERKGHEIDILLPWLRKKSDMLKEIDNGERTCNIDFC